jgi:hypothetical protein
MLKLLLSSCERQYSIERKTREYSGVASTRQHNLNVFSKTEENNVHVNAKNVAFFPFLASCFCLSRT